MTISVRLRLVSGEAEPLTTEDVDAAASVGRLSALGRQLIAEESWSSLEVVLRYCLGPRLPLAELVDVAVAIRDAAAGLPASRRAQVEQELRVAQSQAAHAILRRLARDPLIAAERAALSVAGGIFTGLGEREQAARIFERARDDMRAAEAYGALGDIERMEVCLRREDEQRRRRQAVADAFRRFEALTVSGERRAAIAVAAEIPEDDLDGRSVRAEALAIERRICAGRRVSLRLPSGEVVRIAGTPATLGRDGQCEVALRDPGVSRRHAVIATEEGDPARFTLEDLGSRAGTRLGGASVRGRLPLPPSGELTLGERCTIAFGEADSGALDLRGQAGIDRTLRALVAAGPVSLPAVPGAEGLRLRLEEDTCRLEWPPAVAVRLDGNLVGTGCDLLHGDVFEVGPARLRLQVL